MLSRLWKTTRNRFARTAVVLRYHRVADLDRDPLDLAVAPARFEAHMAILADRADPMPLADLLTAAKRRSLPPRPIAVTFDDGYADNLLCAAEAMRRRGVPGTFFLATGAILRGAEFWWDEVEGAFLAPKTVPPTLDLALGHARWRWHAGVDRRQAFHRLLIALRAIDARARRDAVGALRRWSSTVPVVRPTHRPLSVEETRTLAGIQGMTVGAHTVDHPLLRAQTDACIRQEVEQSRDDIVRLTGAAPRAFAYPFGGRRQFDRRAMRAVRAAGFDLACSTRVDRIWSGSGRWSLPRIAVRDWSAEEFAARLEVDAGWTRNQ